MNVLEAIVGTLPAKAQPYAKTYAAVLVSALTVTSGLLELPAWVTVALAVATAPVVFAVPNLDPQARKQDESVQPPTVAGGGSFIVGDEPAGPTGYGSGV